MSENVNISYVRFVYLPFNASFYRWNPRDQKRRRAGAGNSRTLSKFYTGGVIGIEDDDEEIGGGTLPSVGRYNPLFHNAVRMGGRDTMEVLVGILGSWVLVPSVEGGLLLRLFLPVVV